MADVKRTFTYWISRDSEPETGKLSHIVKIWLSKPRRIQWDVGAIWSNFPADYYGSWTLDECQYHVRTVPDDDRQCIRVEGDGVRAPGELVDREVH